jgi:hypothetical protein
MQRFVAELSIPIAKADFEKSWASDSSLTDGQQPAVDFTFDQCKVLAIIHSDSTKRWECASFYRSFSAAIRRVDRSCNVRWF